VQAFLGNFLRHDGHFADAPAPVKRPTALHSPAARPAPVAQLDRASVYGTEGQRFESSRARSTETALESQISRRAVIPTRVLGGNRWEQQRCHGNLDRAPVAARSLGGVFGEAIERRSSAPRADSAHAAGVSSSGLEARPCSICTRNSTLAGVAFADLARSRSCPRSKSAPEPCSPQTVPLASIPGSARRAWGAPR